MADRHLEIEQKYDAAAGFAVPDLSGLPGVAAVDEPRTHQLHASYFDTPDLRLAAHGITLRRRRGGEDDGWHLKMPVGPDSKSELRAPLGRSRTVPARLASLVAAYTRGAPLELVATLETERRVLRLLDGEGRLLAEVADDAVTGTNLLDGAGTAVAFGEGTAETTGGAGAEPDRWREIEVELGAGPPELLKAAGKKLRKAGAKRAESSSKLGRLLNDAIARPTPKEVRASARAGLEGEPTAGEAVVAYLAAQVDAVLEYDPKVRLSEFDAVHKMRVATRRARSALQTAKSLFDADRVGPLKAELKWLADQLGEVRDLEVLRMRFTERLEDDTVPAWLEDIAKRERAAYRRLHAALKEPRYFALLDALDALVADPPFAGKAAGRQAVKEFPKLVEKAWRRMEGAHAAVATAEDPETAWHEVRKAAKRVRYVAELARPVLGDHARDYAKRAKRVQTVLGEHQDAVIAMEHLAAARPRTLDEAFTLGVLYGVEQCQARHARGQFEAVWASIAD
ncbi:CYTH and CHAD domain-containing protein [Actinomadura kijaniata]|uniref:CHAD domain-containing protein n=1 Tax=Actinomadura namibiensis TaxID=182080 RepID=A0A7W3LL43_ACTNM|nr:CYTH and CHAD domain-containing protein [Actinomadura namibiensis]MBA8950070.1 CHAD domain-containing protein [Actinomadura namibiensis]